VEAMLEIDDLITAYGKSEVLHGVSLRVGKAEIVGLIGANGAGKSTLLNTVMNLVHAKSGSIRVEGIDITQKLTRDIVRMGVTMVPERRQLFGKMKVYENLLLGAYARKGRNQKPEIQSDLENIYEEFPILEERKRQDARNLSGGERQMLAIARAQMSKPKLWLLDEPTLGLAPLLVRQVMDTIVKIRESGGTVLLIEQNAEAALEIVDRAYVLETGRITLSGPAHEIKDDPGVQEAFLGYDDSGEGLEHRIRQIKEKYYI
jgi:branched-chain amino acid transport system ATP-binding protein